MVHRRPSRAQSARTPGDKDTANERFVSIVSVWESAIKVSVGKLTLRDVLETIIPPQLNANDMTLLNVTVDHVARIIALPFHHRDPFDRLLIAQTVADNLAIISADTTFDRYAVNRIW